MTKKNLLMKQSFVLLMALLLVLSNISFAPVYASNDSHIDVYTSADKASKSKKIDIIVHNLPEDADVFAYETPSSEEDYVKCVLKNADGLKIDAKVELDGTEIDKVIVKKDSSEKSVNYSNSGGKILFKADDIDSFSVVKKQEPENSEETNVDKEKAGKEAKTNQAEKEKGISKKEDASDDVPISAEDKMENTGNSSEKEEKAETEDIKKETADQAENEVKETESQTSESERFNNTLKEETKKYEITALFNEKSGLPENAKFVVKEITKNDKDYDYDEYVDKAAKKLKKTPDDFDFIHAFDIYFEDPETGEHLQPDQNVNISIKLLKEEVSEKSEIKIVHFGEKVEEVKNEINDETIEFKADSFSVYVVVDAPEIDVPPDSGNITLADLTGPFSDDGFKLSIHRNNADYYVTDRMNNANCFIESTDPTLGAAWHFEAIANTDDEFYIYLLDNQTKKYIYNQSGNLASLSTSQKTPFKLSYITSEGRYYFKIADQEKWFQHSGGGGGMRFWPDKNNNDNCRIKIEFMTTPVLEDDPFEFDGKTYGLSFEKSKSQAFSLSDTQLTLQGASHLRAEELLIRKDPMCQSNILSISNDIDATMWTFKSIEKDKYYLTANDKYLKIYGGNLTLVDSPDEYCVIKIAGGTGNNAGKIMLKGVASQTTISLSANTTNGFTAVSSNKGYEWLSLFEKSVYENTDFKQYFAYKVSVSDHTNVTNDQKVIVYTRVWNDIEKKYEFYAITHNGELIQCYESGDSIVWIGVENNTMLWNFTEYYRPGTTTSNGYYELKNEYSGKYLAPQIENGQTLSDKPIGINLNGRDSGDYYTPVLAWDDKYFDYAGLKVENGKLVSCPMSQADTFYFAIMKTPEDELEPVETVDHEALGLSIKMKNFDTNDFQCSVLGNPQGSEKKITSGLLSSNIGSNDYPTAVNTGRSLEELFSGATPVNHLFIQSVYDSSGYYQFDSTENSAHLNGSNFEVFQQLGGVDGTAGTRKHGQFMPYNSLDLSTPHPQNPENLTDIYGNALSDNNPRKYETLYDFNEPDDFYFGMEAEGNFIQTPSGKDAWGHDIVFEFVGDDDFWFYVDDELVLDIGGCHPAKGGSVNYSTGEVIVDGAKTTLYDIFKHNYATRNNLSENDPAVTAYLNEKFQEKTVGNKTVHVFKDYSAHNIRIFYMERGAGASNLRMRFNLTTMNENEVLLGKEITGTDNADFASTAFPFQIYYDDHEGDGYKLLEQEMMVGANTRWRVVYQNTSTKVPFDAQTTIDGETYENVFYLKPGQTAAATMPELPEGTVDYYIKECGVDTSIYNGVYVNDEQITGTAGPNSTHTQSFESSPATINERARIIFKNNVDPEALRTLTITKKLFDENGNLLTAEQDSTKFTTRIRLGENLDYYNRGDYYVKDPTGHYCYFDSEQGKFRSIGVSNFASLTPEQKARVTFKTSPSGAASKLPSEYSIEIRNLLVGTKFNVIEEDHDIPLGYGKRVWTETENGITKTYFGYKRVAGSYLVGEGDTENSGTIRDNSNPHIEIHNQKGWGIRAEKDWSDKDFMLSHDDIYFAVYVNGTLLPGTLKKIDGYNYTTYFFQHLEQGATFSDYKVKEVELKNPVEHSDGSITYTSITPLDEGDTITVGGTDSDHIYEPDNEYKVYYTQGTNPRSRTDIVSNNRGGGLKIMKVDMNGNPVPNAKFEIRQGNTLIGMYTSNALGLITDAYLEDGVYELKEAEPPRGYQTLGRTFTVTVNNGTISVSGNPSAYTFDQANSILTIKNKAYTLKFTKTDSQSNTPLEGAHFALYRQITKTNGEVRPDYYPMEGYEDLVTGANGVIPKANETLKAGSYYLIETQEPSGYKPAVTTKSVLFTIDSDGHVTVDNSSDHTGTLTMTDSGTIVNYSVTVPNTSADAPAVTETLRFYIVDENDNPITIPAAFDFNGIYDDISMGTYTTERWTSSGGLLHTDLTLNEGTFKLMEVTCPEGYQPIMHNLNIRVLEGRVTSTSPDVSIAKENGVWVVKIHYTKEVIAPTGFEQNKEARMYVLILMLLVLTSLSVFARYVSEKKE